MKSIKTASKSPATSSNMTHVRQRWPQQWIRPFDGKTLQCLFTSDGLPFTYPSLARRVSVVFLKSWGEGRMPCPGAGHTGSTCLRHMDKIREFDQEQQTSIKWWARSCTRRFFSPSLSLTQRVLLTYLNSKCWIETMLRGDVKINPQSDWLYRSGRVQ